MRPSELLKPSAAREWRANLAHPFVRGIGTGTLPKRKFCYYLEQDYVFLIDFSRVLALASAKAASLADMTRFAELLHSTLATEMDLHRRLCVREGISPAVLERTEPSPTTSTSSPRISRTARRARRRGRSAWRSSPSRSDHSRACRMASPIAPRAARMLTMPK